MTHICIQNSGEIAAEALTLIGASTKRDNENSIGFFGSGNKYALAFLLRNAIPFRIFSGETEVLVTTEDVSFRDQSFAAILINGVRTGLTTGAGPDWKPWEAFRELYSNALDEGGAEIFETSDPSGAPNLTRIFLPKTSSVGQIYADLDRYFTARRVPLWREGRNAIFPAFDSSRPSLFRRGILVKEDFPDTNLPRIPFDLDLHELSINESRELRGTIQDDRNVWGAIFRCDNPQIVSAIASADLASVNLWHGQYTLSQPWLDLLSSRVVCDSFEFASDLLSYDERSSALVVHSSFISVLTSCSVPLRRPHRIASGKKYDETRIDPHSASRIRSALRLLARGGILIDEKDIILANFFAPEVLGMWDAKAARIVLSPHAISRGRSDLANTLIEEHIHRLTGAPDNSRAFQDAAIKIIVTLLEDMEADGG